MRAGAQILLGCALAGCAPAPTRNDAGPRPTLASLNPCSDAVLAEVAEPGQILGLSHYSADPASSSMDVNLARRFPALGESGEEVLALRPDVVIAGTTLAPATAAAIERAGIRLVRLPVARSLAESRAQVRALARLAGHPARGAALDARIVRALDRARPDRDDDAIPAIVWQSGGIVAGDETLIADLLRHAGFANAAAARGLGQADYLPLERMVADPPRLILVAGTDGANADRLLSHRVLARLPGVRRERLEPALLWCGGPTIVRAARRLAELRRAL